MYVVSRTSNHLLKLMVTKDRLGSAAMQDGEFSPHGKEARHLRMENTTYIVCQELQGRSRSFTTQESLRSTTITVSDPRFKSAKASYGTEFWLKEDIVDTEVVMAVDEEKGWLSLTVLVYHNTDCGVTPSTSVAVLSKWFDIIP